MPRCQGEHITLREYRADDLSAIHAWVNDPETVRYLSSRYWMPQSMSDTSDFLNHAMQAGTNGAYFVIAEPETGEYLGQIDLFSINWRMRSGEMAIVVAKEAKRGRGTGTEAVRLMLAFAFGTLGLERVELEVATGNQRAMRCYEKAGFRLEGVKRHAFMVDGQYADLAVMAVLAEEWRAARQG